VTLTAVMVLRKAYRTARAEPGRVFLPALVIFGLQAASDTLFTEISTDHLGIESLAAFGLLMVSTLGLTFYSGLMERLVGAVERGHEAPPVFRVLRTLPYGRLLLADLILWIVSGVTSLAFVIPGLIVSTLFALIGPLINMEDHTVRAAFRRSYELVAPKFLLVLCLVTVPLAAENELVEAVALLAHHEHVWLVYLTHLALGLVFGVSLGLIEVALAERLVHQAAGPGPESEAAGPGPGSEAAGPGPGSEAAAGQPGGAPLPSTGQAGRGGHHGRDDSRNGHAGTGALPPTGGVGDIGGR